MLPEQCFFITVSQYIVENNEHIKNHENYKHKFRVKHP